MYAFSIDIEYVFSDGIDMVLSQVHIKKLMRTN